MDMVVKTTHIPEPGETVLSGSFFMTPGGKGANQAVAAARIGGDVIFVSKVGNDIFGRQSVQNLDEEGINTAYILSDREAPSGVALITVDEHGENSIVVASGSNANLLPMDLTDVYKEIDDQAIILLQLEIPMTTVEHVICYSSSKGATVVLNPAPMNDLSGEALRNISIITPNQKEAEKLAGFRITDIDSAFKAAEKIYEDGVRNVIVTLGASGAVVCEKGNVYHIAAPAVEATDTTAAGDVFNGALVIALSEGKSLRDAVNFACRASAISVTRLGAQTSIPYRNEILADELSEKSGVSK